MSTVPILKYSIMTHFLSDLILTKKDHQSVPLNVDHHTKNHIKDTITAIIITRLLVVLLTQDAKPLRRSFLLIMNELNDKKRN